MSNNIEYALQWFKQATFDLNAAISSKESKDFEWACFQAQQASGKALKAFLYSRKKRNILTHSIFKLINECGKLDKDFLDLKETKVLDQYYVPTRYPNGLPSGILMNFFQ